MVGCLFQLIKFGVGFLAGMLVLSAVGSFIRGIVLAIGGEPSLSVGLNLGGAVLLGFLSLAIYKLATRMRLTDTQ